MKKVNLACGSIYVKQSDWINLDYFPIGDGVIQADLLGTLPFKQGSISLVYSSHFIEHIPRAKVGSFLSECFRILEPGGAIRLVLPDLEQMCSQYLDKRKQQDHKKADFCVVEMIDQCVRLESGGELGLLYEFYSQSFDKNIDMVEYIRSFNGEVLCKIQNQGNNNFEKIVTLLRKPKVLYSKIAYYLERYYIRVIISLLPRAFRTQNVSLAAVGERHHWLWDFYQLQQVLESVGFVEVSRCKFNTSRVTDFPFQPLDIDLEGFPRKGLESMYVEAQKPN
jgi:SAM-dependent methyltransferase